MSTIDWKEFDVIEPRARKKTAMVATIVGNGETRLNSALLKRLGAGAAEFRLKKDGKILAVLPSGENTLAIHKSGVVKNYVLTEKIEKIKIKLPAYYVFEYDDENQALIGYHSAYNPNSKRSKEK